MKTFYHEFLEHFLTLLTAASVMGYTVLILLKSKFRIVTFPELEKHCKNEQEKCKICVSSDIQAVAGKVDQVSSEIRVIDKKIEDDRKENKEYLIETRTFMGAVKEYMDHEKEKKL